MKAQTFLSITAAVSAGFAVTVLAGVVISHKEYGTELGWPLFVSFCFGVIGILAWVLDALVERRGSHREHLQDTSSASSHHSAKSGSAGTGG